MIAGDASNPHTVPPKSFDRLMLFLLYLINGVARKRCSAW